MTGPPRTARLRTEGEAASESEESGTTPSENGTSSQASGRGADDGSDDGENGAPDGDGENGAPDGDDGMSGDDGQAGLDAFAGETEGESESEPEETDVAADDSKGTAATADDSEGTVATADPSGEDTEIVVDQRELDAAIAKDLSRREGITTRLETLAVGDYVLSDRVVVERKTVSDFLDTLTGSDERSMFEQVKDATRNYARPVVVIEGTNLYGERSVHPNAIRGALASLAVDFGASVLRTSDEDETADLLEVIAGREQETADREVSVHGEKQSKTLPEQQEYVVASIAEVGPVTARTLLEHFGSVEAVMTAEKDDLLEVSGIGDVTADRIREVIASDYDS